MFLIRLKPEYDGVTITKNIVGLGEVTFSPTVKEENYDNYLNLGFDIFQVYDTDKEEYIKDITKVQFERFN